MTTITFVPVPGTLCPHEKRLKILTELRAAGWQTLNFQSLGIQVECQSTEIALRLKAWMASRRYQEYNPSLVARLIRESRQAAERELYEQRRPIEYDPYYGY